MATADWKGEGYREEIEANRRTFAMMIEAATRCGEAEAWAEAAARTQMAAHFAHRSHAGIFASDALEGLLDAAAAHLPASRAGRERRQLAGDRERVLHVMTGATPIGGHTRLVARWIELDTERRHSVAITGMFSSALPSLTCSPPPL